MIKKIFISGLILMISGCANKPNSTRYESELSVWLGQSEDSLYSKWGYPNTTYSVGPDVFIATYIKQHNRPIDADGEPYANEMNYSAMETPSYGMPEANGIYYCKTSFVIKNGIISDYNFNGDDCVR